MIETEKVVYKKTLEKFWNSWSIGIDNRESIAYHTFSRIDVRYDETTIESDTMKKSNNMQAGSIVKELAEIFESIVECVDVPMRTKSGKMVRMTLSEIVERQDKTKRQAERKAKKQADKIREQADKNARLEIYAEFGDDINDGLGLPYDDIDIDERRLNNNRILFLRSLVS